MAAHVIGLGYRDTPTLLHKDDNRFTTHAHHRDPCNESRNPSPDLAISAPSFIINAQTCVFLPIAIASLIGGVVYRGVNTSSTSVPTFSRLTKCTLTSSPALARWRESLREKRPQPMSWESDILCLQSTWSSASPTRRREAWLAPNVLPISFRREWFVRWIEMVRSECCALGAVDCMSERRWKLER